MKASFLAVALLLAGCGGDPKPDPQVSLVLTGARARAYTDPDFKAGVEVAEVRDLLIECDLVIDNQTGKELKVRSNFQSALDHLNLVLLRGDQVVTEVAFIEHLSPSSSDGKLFPVAQGETTIQLRFPVSQPPADWKALRVKVYGYLPDSGYEQLLESETVTIDPKEGLSSP